MGNKVNNGGKASIKKAQQAAKNALHDPFSRIHSLPPDRQEELLKMLRMDSPYNVAKIVQEDWQECLDVAHVTLSHQLEKYRKAKIPTHELVNPFVSARLRGEFQKSVNLYTTMSHTIELQIARLREARLLEEEAGKPLPQTDREIHLLLRALKVAGDLSFRAGLLEGQAVNFKLLLKEDHDNFVMGSEQLVERFITHMLMKHPTLFDSLSGEVEH